MNIKEIIKISVISLLESILLPILFRSSCQTINFEYIKNYVFSWDFVQQIIVFWVLFLAINLLLIIFYKKR